jgi:hypothetical protein
MIQIIKITIDNSAVETGISVMVCSSIDAAKEAILNELNEKFNGKWTSLKEAALALNKQLEHCTWFEDDKVLNWMNNGMGNEYTIARINIREVNTKFQKC